VNANGALRMTVMVPLATMAPWLKSTSNATLSSTRLVRAPAAVPEPTPPETSGSGVAITTVPVKLGEAMGA
jgi:hypothetical protein